MQSFFRFLLKYQTFILFILLIAGSVFLIVKHNSFQRTHFANAFYTVQGSVYAPVRKTAAYLSLNRENIRLSEENASLHTRLLQAGDTLGRVRSIYDTLYRQQYLCIPAQVVQNTTSKQYNYLTLNRGELDGITADMAVIGPDGIVGIVTASSPHFATVLSVLNRDFSVSAKFLTSQFFGSLVWDGRSPYYATLNDIPLHAPVHIGDTLVCSGFSSMFPEGTPVGTVEDFDKDDGNFYNIRVRLASSFRQLYHVTVIKDLYKDEQNALETGHNLHN